MADPEVFVDPERLRDVGDGNRLAVLSGGSPAAARDVRRRPGHQRGPGRGHRRPLGLDTGLDEYIERSGKLPAAWPSGTAAEERAAAFRAEIANTHEPCQRISAALRTQADTIYRLQGFLTDILAECEGNGLNVDLVTGMVSAKPGSITGTASAARMPGLIEGYNQQLSDIYVQATNIDADTRVTLQMCLPEPGSGFGAAAGPALTEADVAAQRGRTPGEVHLWWQSLSRSQQDQAMRDFPLLVGSLDGVPADDRDAANRAALEAQKQRVHAAMSASGAWDAADPELEEQRQRIQKIEDTLAGLGDRVTCSASTPRPMTGTARSSSRSATRTPPGTPASGSRA
jgi:hypothetical protein